VSWRAAAWALGGLVAALAALRATPMAKVVLWSPMRGRVLIDGVPAAGAVLAREFNWHWGNKQGGDRVVADGAGEFSFPALFGRMLLGQVLPHEPVIEQVMTIDYGGKSYGAWYHFNHDDSLDAENDGRPIVMTCRLDAQPSPHGRIMGLCEFE